MNVGDIMHTKVWTADANDTFADVAKEMSAHGISSVVVLVDGNEIAGIVTERDIVTLVGAGGDPHSVKVSQGMTRRDIETVTPDTDINAACEHMVSRNIRHLPVVKNGKLAGIVSIRDLTRWAAEELAAGHEMPDIAASHRALEAATQLQRKRQSAT